MAYLIPAEFVTKMVDAGESKIYMATRDVLIRAYMAGAILALAAVFAVTATVMSGSALVGAILFRSASACSTCWASTCSPASSC
jgi:formate/nitrite transporter FocA (FNT family)